MFNAATSVGNVALFAGGTATEGAADAALHQLKQLYRRLIDFDTLCCLFFLNVLHAFVCAAHSTQRWRQSQHH
jgi:hypothetical protein